MVLLLLVANASAAEPVLLPLSADSVVGDRVVRAALVGTADSFGGASGELMAEGAIASRVALAVRAGAQVGGDEPLVGAEVRVEIVEEGKSPVGLGAAARYSRVGFDGVDAEMEANVVATTHLGATRAFVGVSAGRDVEEPEGDVELGLGALHPLGRGISAGVDARGRLAVGEVEHEDREIEDRRGWDVRAGAVVTAGSERVSGYVFGGVSARSEGEASAAGAMGSVGVQAAF